MKKQKAGKTFLFLSILAVVAASGCVSFGGGGEQTVEASPDVMSFSDSTIIPNPPILTGDTFTTSFAVKNLDEFADANNVKIELYDWGVCAPSSCSPSDWGIDGKKSSYSTSFGAVSPQDVQQVECQFKSPSSEKIGGLDARCPIRYKMTYDFSGVTTTELNIISNQKFQDMQRAGQTPSASSTQSKSRGPIKVDFSFGVNQPARASTTGSIVKIPMYVTVENKGSGKAILGSVAFKNTNTKCTDSDKKDFNSGVCFGNKADTYFCNNGVIDHCGKNTDSSKDVDTSLCANNNGCIKSNTKLNIKIPAALTSSGTTSTCAEIKCDGFFSGSAEGTDSCKLTLTKKIDFVKDKSQIFRCELTSPSDSVVPEQKTFSIQSEVKYTYQIDNDFSVAIKPMTVG